MSESFAANVPSGTILNKLLTNAFFGKRIPRDSHLRGHNCWIPSLHGSNTCSYICLPYAVTVKIAVTFCRFFEVPDKLNATVPFARSYFTFIMLTTISSVVRHVEKPSVSSTSAAWAGTITSAIRKVKTIVEDNEGGSDNEDGNPPYKNRRNIMVIVFVYEMNSRCRQETSETVRFYRLSPLAV
jgi:hypothetical protein